MAQKKAVIYNQTPPPQKAAVAVAVTRVATRKEEKAGGKGKVDISKKKCFFFHLIS